MINKSKSLPVTNQEEMSADLIDMMSILYMVGYNYQNIMLNPDLILRKLQIDEPWREAEFYEQIMVDDMVQTCIQKRKRASTALKWRIKKDESADDVHESVKNNFKFLDRKGLVRNTNQNIIKTLDTGRQFIQTDWQYFDGLWQGSNLTPLPLECMLFDVNNDIQIRQLGNLEIQPVPPYRVLKVTNDTTLKNKYGDSLLTKCYWPVFFKKNAIQFANVWLERDGMPWIITQYDNMMLQELFPHRTADNGEFDAEGAMEDFIEFIKSKSGDGLLIVPKGIDVKIENPAKDGNMDNYEKVKNSMNDAIINIYTGHVATTKPTAGKLGGEVNANTDWVAVVNDCKELMTSTWNTYISWYVQINYGDKTPCPEFEFIEKTDVNKELAERDGILCKDGGVRYTKQYYKNKYGFSDDEFDVDYSTQAAGTPTQ